MELEVLLNLTEFFKTCSDSLQKVQYLKTLTNFWVFVDLFPFFGVKMSIKNHQVSIMDLTILNHISRLVSGYWLVIKLNRRS